jgi:hypothetical protein
VERREEVQGEDEHDHRAGEATGNAGTDREDAAAERPQVRRVGQPFTR